MESAMEEFIKNPFNVQSVIKDINDSFADTMENRFPTSVHRNPYDYYMSGSCPAYAEILYNVFKGYAEYYIGPGHVMVKIGKWFYDVKGFDSEVNEADGLFKRYSEDHMDMTYIDMHRKDGSEEAVRDDLIEVGKESLKRHMLELGLIGKSL